jgi:sugar (pentulose or hexulose) kinase
LSGEYIAVDIGGSSVKLFTGKLDSNRIVICDQQTIPNKPLNLNGHVYVDVYKLYDLLKTKIGQICSNGFEPISLGIDTYGNGYGIFDKDYCMIGLPLFYKDPCLQDNLNKIAQKVSLRGIYDQTGVFPTNIRVLMQLYSEISSGSSRILSGKHFLLLPDLLGYFLTGNLVAERSIASVASLLDRNGINWCFDLLEKLSVPRDIFPPLVDGWRDDTRVPFLPEIYEELNLKKMNLVKVVSHDTESALLAAPMLDRKKLFVSMGTSVICGVQIDRPVINDDAYRQKFKNIYGAFGSYSLCKDFNGLWILEKCIEYWRRNNPSLTYDDVISACELERSNYRLIDVNDASIKFYKNSMPEAINEYCLQNNQPEAYSIGEIANCIFASIAVQIKSVFEEIKLLTGKDDFDGICVVGGAVKNDLLMQMVSDAISLPLYKGSEFSASIGNLLMQMYTNHELNSIGEIKEVAMNTSGLNVVRPKGSQRKWTDALGSMIKYRTINERENNGRKN